ncbi:hypothetical protein MAR_031616, partial [Mya arenaria]
MYIRSIISLEIIIQIYLVVLYTKLALFCGLTEGQDFEFKQAGYDKIDIPSPKVWIRDVSFEVCRDECKVRPSCTAVNYHTFVFLCELDLEPSPEVVPTTDRGEECSNEKEEKCCTDSDMDCGTANIGECFCEFGRNSSGKCYPECKGQFEVCTQIGDYDGCNSNDELGECFCKHVNETDKNKCCEECSDDDKEKCCTDSDMDCGMANIGECFCKFGEDPSGTCC